MKMLEEYQIKAVVRGMGIDMNATVNKIINDERAWNAARGN